MTYEVPHKKLCRAYALRSIVCRSFGPGEEHNRQAVACSSPTNGRKGSEGATIKGFASDKEQGQQFYELSLDVNGHNKDILMDRSGNVVEVEEELTFDSLPLNVQDALTETPAAARSR